MSTDPSDGGGADSTQRHPPSTYQAKYPYNQKWVTRSGHEAEFDDTPGATRIRLAHGKSGTYVEISDDGKRVDMITGKQIIYCKQGQTLTADGNMDYKIGGSQRLSISGDNHQEVAGDSTRSTGGNEIALVGGDSTSAVHGDMTMGITGGATYKFGGGGQIKFDCKTAQSDVTLLSDGDINVESATQIFLGVGQSSITMTTESILLQVGGSSITINPSSIWIDAGTVSISKATFIGQGGKGGTSGPNVLTLAGPAIQAFALV